MLLTDPTENMDGRLLAESARLSFVWEMLSAAGLPRKPAELWTLRYKSTSLTEERLRCAAYVDTELRGAEGESRARWA